MSPRRRAALHTFARKNAAIIIEDDYDGEFHFDGAPVDALWSPDTSDHVFYVGTFSKSILPAFRLGFIIAPDWALDTLTLIKNSTDGPRSIPVERSVAGFIAEGHLVCVTSTKITDVDTASRRGHYHRFPGALPCTMAGSIEMQLRHAPGGAVHTTSISMERAAQTVRDRGVAIRHTRSLLSGRTHP